MQVLHVIAGISPKQGGPAVFALEVARNLLELEDIHSEIVTTDADLLHRCVGSRLTHHPFPVTCFHSPFGQRFGFAPQLARWLSANVARFDVVHLHGVFTYSTFVAARQCQAQDVPMVLRPAGHLDEWSMGRRAILKRIVLKTVGRPAIGADVIQAASEFEADAIRRLFPGGNIEVIPLAVSPIESRNSDSVRSERFRALFFSRLDPKKGLETLLNAVRRISNRGLEIELTIAGEGRPSYVNGLRDLCKRLNLTDEVEFVGFITGSEKEQLFATHDVLVLPSLDENFGLAVAEAMSAGLPVVVSDRVGLASLVQANRAGIVLEVNSVDHLAGVLGRLSESRDELAAMADNATELARRQWSWSAVCSSLREMYEGIQQ